MDCDVADVAVIKLYIVTLQSHLVIVTTSTTSMSHVVWLHAARVVGDRLQRD